MACMICEATAGLSTAGIISMEGRHRHLGLAEWQLNNIWKKNQWLQELLAILLPLNMFFPPLNWSIASYCLRWEFKWGWTTDGLRSVAGNQGHHAERGVCASAAATSHVSTNNLSCAGLCEWAFLLPACNLWENNVCISAADAASGWNWIAGKRCNRR